MRTFKRAPRRYVADSAHPLFCGPHGPLIDAYCGAHGFAIGRATQRAESSKSSEGRKPTTAIGAWRLRRTFEGVPNQGLERSHNGLAVRVKNVNNCRRAVNTATGLADILSR
jgi:hypothetical protein